MILLIFVHLSFIFFSARGNASQILLWKFTVLESLIFFHVNSQFVAQSLLQKEPFFICLFAYVLNFSLSLIVSLSFCSLGNWFLLCLGFGLINALAFQLVLRDCWNWKGLGCISVHSPLCTMCVVNSQRSCLSTDVQRVQFPVQWISSHSIRIDTLQIVQECCL